MGFDFGSFFGGILGGLITLFGVYKTVKYYKESDIRREELKLFSERPDLKSVSKRDKAKPDVEAILVPVEGVNSVQENWVTFSFKIVRFNEKAELEFHDYYFENAGNRAITYISFISTNKKLFTLYDLSSEISIKSIMEGDPNYEVNLDKRVDPGEIIKVRMYYHKKVWGNPISAPISVVLTDTYNKLYSQPFFYPSEKIYSSKNYVGGYEQYRKDASVDDYMDYIIDLNEKKAKDSF
jgi:hypothetical protein